VHGFDSVRLAYRKYLPIERFMQYRCKAIVGVCKYDTNNLLSENINNHIECIYNGIEKPIRLQRDPFKLFNNYRYKILCIARLSPQKNCDLFLNLALLLPEYAFIWIGNQFKPMGIIPSNVFFMGNIPNAGAYNEYVDLFILPSNYEGLPIVILEAMSFGKPIVASNVGGISEIVINNENGYTVENIPETFAEKIKYILENKDIYKRFAENTLKRYEKDLTVEKMIEGYRKIYQS
jgi:glycosyltransferase involved in cell wall biosynthesis